MSNMIVGLLAETFIHSGAGQNEGAIDLPVAREAATDYPFLPGSGLKGALRDYVRRHWNEERVDRCFGKPESNAGGVLVSDGRLLLLPVRSLSGTYKWLTCPHILERFRRDLERAHLPVRMPVIEKPEPGRAIGSGTGRLYLEERQFEYCGAIPTQLVEAIAPFIAHEDTRRRLPQQMLVIDNNDFNWFARFALAIQARNVLEIETKKSNNLWYEESLPPDTIMYTLLGERITESGIAELAVLIDRERWFQTGANETVGQGWFAMARVSGENSINGEKSDES